MREKNDRSYVRDFAFNKGIGIRESRKTFARRIQREGKILLKESEILAFGIQNTAQGFWNQTNDWN